MFGLKKLRFADIGTGLSMMFGTAGLLVASALHAAEPGCCTPAPCRPTIQGGGCCDKIYEDAAERLKNLNPGCSAPAGCAPTGCAPAASVCDPNAVFNGCGSGCGSGCGNGGGHGCGLLGGELGDPWTVVSLFDDECGKNHFKDNGWVMGGYTQFGYQNRPDGAFTGNGPFLNQREWNRFALNQQYLFLGKVANGSEGLGFGFRADFMYGIDGNEGQSFGNINPGHYDYLNGWGGPGDPNPHGPYESALPQLYAEAAFKDLSVKVGHFYTPTGYEVIPSNGNFFLSHQLTWYNSEAFTHTGVLANYKVNDKLQVQAGWTLGWDTGFYQFDGGSNFLGGFIYNIDDKTSFIEATTIGNLGWRGDGILNTAILSRKWTDKVSTVHQFDVLSTNLSIGGAPATFLVNGVNRDSVSILNYAFYDLTPKVKLGVRQEWWKADSLSYHTWTYGVNVKPTANLTIRPEVRHMFSSNQNVYTGLGYSDQLYNQTVFGVDAIFTF